jgi:uncharacterized membrane protein
MAKQSKKIVHVLLVCIYIRQFTHVRLTVTTMEVSNTISELGGQLSPSQKGPVFREVVWRIRPPLKETNQQNRLQPA